jgi:hypothetical protein
VRSKALIAASITLLVACQRQPYAPPVEALAKVTWVKVRSHEFVLPVVAVTWAGNSKVLRPCEESHARWLCAVPTEVLVASAGVQGAPVSASSVTVELEGYSRFKNTKLDEWFDIPQLCEMLTQRWARQQCLRPNLFKDNLRRFNVIEIDSLTKENGLFLIGGQRETVRSVVHRMKFFGEEPNIDCAPDGNGLCTAAIPIGDGVVAVWAVSNSDSGPDSIRRQATAIRAFLTHAVGKQEDYEKLRASLAGAT